MPAATPQQIESFITRWENSGAAERANYQMFLSELCDILEVPRPDPTSPDPAKNLHVFDRAITRVNSDGSSVTNYIDLYKARHFVCETKQGVSSESGGDILSPPSLPSKSGHGKRGTAAFDRALERAFHQGRGYITSLPVAEGRPPFLIVCDVGHSIDLYAEFSGTGGHYERFPDPKNHRILLTDLRQEKHRATLRAIWTDPVVTTALPFSAAQLAMLTDAAATDWSGVEPSIFGTLLTRALDPRERHKLGAEYTPRSYVERLIRPTIIEPLRDRPRKSPEIFPKRRRNAGHLV